MPAGSRRKSVRFAHYGDDQQLLETIYEVPRRTDLGTDDCEALFFNRNDFKWTRSVARSESQDVARNGESEALQTAFGLKSKVSQDILNSWVTADHLCRGLEKWCNRAHGEKRQLEQFAATMAVLQAQHDMKSSEKRVDSDALRNVATKVTRNARHFARMMGKADSLAVALLLKSDSTLLNAPTHHWDPSTLRLIKENRAEDDKSITDSVHDSTTIPNAANLSSLLMGASDDEMDDDIEDVAFIPDVDEVPDNMIPESPRRKSKIKKLRLLKRIRRRMSLSSAGRKSGSATNETRQ